MTDVMEPPISTENPLAIVAQIRERANREIDVQANRITQLIADCDAQIKVLEENRRELVESTRKIRMDYSDQNRKRRPYKISGNIAERRIKLREILTVPRSSKEASKLLGMNIQSYYNFLSVEKKSGLKVVRLAPLPGEHHTSGRIQLAE